MYGKIWTNRKRKKVEFAGKALVKSIQSVHGRCTGVSGKLHNVAGFRCKKCVDGQLENLWPAIKEIMISSLVELEYVGKFYYLGDGGAEEASR